jgi:hypothetical protein
LPELLLHGLVVLNGFDKLRLDQASLHKQGRPMQTNKHLHIPHLLFPNLAISARRTLFLQRLDPSLKNITECTGISHKFFELSCVTLGEGIVGVVQRTCLQVRDAGNVVVKSPQAILNRRNLRKNGVNVSWHRKVRRITPRCKKRTWYLCLLRMSGLS